MTITTDNKLSLKKEGYLQLAPAPTGCISTKGSFSDQPPC